MIEQQQMTAWIQSCASAERQAVGIQAFVLMHFHHFVQSLGIIVSEGHIIYRTVIRTPYTHLTWYIYFLQRFHTAVPVCRGVVPGFSHGIAQNLDSF